MDVPETRYANVGDSEVAFQVFGEGPDLVVTLGLAVSHIDHLWEQPDFERLLRRLGSFSRVAIFDRRGMGASGRLGGDTDPTWEHWMDDVNAVIAAAGMDRPSLMAANDAGAMAMLFAATHPQRISSLVLTCACARITTASDYPFGVPPEQMDAFAAMIGEHWGREAGQMTEWFAADRAGDPGFRKWFARLQRAAMTPGQVSEIYPVVLGIDAREALELIQAPTLVAYVPGDQMVPPQHAVYIAEHVAGAKLLPLDGVSGLGWLRQQDTYLSAIEEHVTGRLGPVEPDRVLATVLFTDIVGSTERAAELGDRRWRELLDRHDEMAGRAVDQFGGRLVKSTGDGILATFDGPARAVRAAASLGEQLKVAGVSIRSGLHAGEVELRGADVGGMAIHIAARVMSLAQPGEILVSAMVKGLVAGSGLAFEDRGIHTLKGVPDEWAIHAVAGAA
ncbi:MAG: adenylate/guanylate cyclase domain-containing protein [Actinomycetota bacterium]